MRLTADEAKRKNAARSSAVLIALVVLGAIALVPYCLLVLLVPAWRSLERPIVQPGRVLLVTAHPDDETVFFGPTITALHGSQHEVFLLCLTTGTFQTCVAAQRWLGHLAEVPKLCNLVSEVSRSGYHAVKAISTGNARGLGHIRTKELTFAAAALKIDAKHLSVENSQDKLPDSKTADWDLPFAQSLIKAAVQRWQINTLITFDRGGVTGHKNHMSCWRAVQNILAECTLRSCPQGWSLLSAGEWRRYSMMVESAPSVAEEQSQTTARYLNHSIFQVFRAMSQHKTQWRWWSHVLFTRFTYVNTLSQMRGASAVTAVS